MLTICWNRQNFFFILKVVLLHTFIVGYCRSIEFCQPSVQQLTYTQMGDSIYNITSPGYPVSTYTESGDCDIVLQITLPQEGVLNIEYQEVLPPDCTSNYLVLTNNDSALRYFSRCLQPPAGGSLQLTDVLLRNGINVTSRVQVRLPAASGRNRFRINLKILPLLPMRPGIANSYFTTSLTETPSGYISSHETFDNFYAPDTHTFLELANIPEKATGIFIEFIYFKIGNQEICRRADDRDRVKIFTLNNTELRQQFFCSDTFSLPSSLVLNFTDESPTTSLRFEFLTDKTEHHQGFLLKYSLLPNNLTLPVSESVPSTTKSETLSSVTSTTPTQGVTTINDSLNTNEKFFEKDMNIIAVAAGGGGLILIIIIIILCCVICKRNQTSKSRSEEAFPTGGKEGTDVDSRIIQISLTPATRRSEAGLREKSAGNKYSSVDLELPDPYSSVDMDSSNPHTFVLKENNNGNATKIPEVPLERREPDGADTPGVEIYAAINQKTKKKKVEMMENDLYVSRDSIDSDQSAD